MQCIALPSLSLFTFSFKKVPPVWYTWYHVSYSSCIAVSLRPSSKSSPSNTNVNFKTAEGIVKNYLNKSVLFDLATDSAVPLCNCLWFVDLRESSLLLTVSWLERETIQKPYCGLLSPKFRFKSWLSKQLSSFLWSTSWIDFFWGNYQLLLKAITLLICYWLGKY